MKRSAEVVIGANYGDEGKGLVTDAVCESISADLVVRFNGGSQAGHTVVRNGRMHVFHHLGSGTMLGVPTFLSKHFVVNPIVFHSEFDSLSEFNPKVYIDYRAPVTTPFDIMINHAAEMWRGSNKHGSCGLGINETVTRHDGAFSFSAVDITENRDFIFTKLENIRKIYVPKRMEELDIPIPTEMANWLKTDQIVERYYEDLIKMLHRTVLVSHPNPMFQTCKRVVFEGAQGLAIDQNSLDFPYVTRSNTGLTNALEVMGDMRLPEYGVTYVTRSYLTRHGQGPLPNESAVMQATMMNPNETNQWNVFQGALRFAQLDVVALSNRIAKDLATNDLIQPERVRLAVTHCDRPEQNVIIMNSTKQEAIPTSKLIDFFRKHFWSIEVVGSYGYTADTFDI